jgi:ketosteroid isomerase-like protein
MSQSDFELVQRAWNASATDGIDALIQHLHPDIEIVPFGAAMEGTAYRGLAGVKRWWEQEIEANWETFETHAEDFEQVGDRLVIFGRWVARSRTSRVDLIMPATWIVDVRDGKIARWETYTDRAEALAAARRPATAGTGTP